MHGRCDVDARELDSISRRPLRYWSQDGIHDLFFGALLLLFGVIQWGMYARQPLLVVLPLLLALVVSGPIGKKLVVRVKERLVFPRTGAIELRQSKPPRMAFVAAVVATLLLWQVFILLSGTLYRWGPMSFALIFGAMFIWTSQRLGLRRHLVVGVITLGFGIALGVAAPHDQLGFIVFFLGLGTLQVLSGAIALAAFLHSAPPAPQE
jgi:hypothetical protein